MTLITPRGDSDAEGLITIAGRKLGPPSRRLTFHQRKLKITRADISARTKKGDQHIGVDRINHHRSFEHVRLHTKTTLYPGQYLVTMAFIVKPPANGEKPDVIKRAFEAGSTIRGFFPSIDEPEANSNASLEINVE